VPKNSFEQSSQQHLEWVSDQVAVLFLTLGYALTAERQVLFAQALADIAQGPLELGFTKAARESTYEPRPADVRKLAGFLAEQQELGEADKAWQVAIEFVDKWVVSDHEGMFYPSQGVRSEPMPKLAQRILDVVKRTGGWGPYKWRTEKSVPFLHRDFVQEYKVWAYAESVDESKMLTPGDALKQLPGATAKLSLVARPAEPPAVPTLKKTPEPLTEIECKDRREMLKQQAAAWKSRRSK
jgi:hypothetical protein